MPLSSSTAASSTVTAPCAAAVAPASSFVGAATSWPLALLICRAPRKSWLLPRASAPAPLATAASSVATLPASRLSSPEPTATTTARSLARLSWAQNGTEPALRRAPVDQLVELLGQPAGSPGEPRRPAGDHRLRGGHLPPCPASDAAVLGQRRASCWRAALRRCAACGRPSRHRQRPARPRPLRWRPSRARCQAGGSRSHLAEAVGQLARRRRRAARHPAESCAVPSASDAALEAAYLFDLAIWLKPSYTFFR